MEQKQTYFLWTMDLCDVMSETDNRQQILNWHEFMMCIERRDLIEGLTITSIDQDLDDGQILNIVNLEYKANKKTFYITAVLNRQIDILNAMIRFDQDQRSQEIVQAYFFAR